MILTLQQHGVSALNTYAERTGNVNWVRHFLGVSRFEQTLTDVASRWRGTAVPVRCRYNRVPASLIQQNSGAAASVMLKLMADPATPASVRARNAQCILEQANKSLEREDILVRIRRLEEERNKN